MVDCKLQLTDIGLQKQAQGNVDGSIITITHMAVGDGGGDYYELDSSASSLVNEFYRFEVAAGDISIDSVNKNKIKIDGYIPASQGGNTTREIGIFDSTGDMIAHGLFPLIEIPSQDSNARIDIYIKEYLEVSNSELFEIVVNQANAVATINDLEDYLPLEGGTMQGDIDFNQNKISNLPGGVELSDPVVVEQLHKFTPDYVTGLEVLYNSENSIKVASGACKDEFNNVLIQMPEMVKTLAPFSSGDGNGGLDANEGIQPSSAYGIYAIAKTIDINDSDILITKGITGNINVSYASPVQGQKVKGYYSPVIYNFSFSNPLTKINRVIFKGGFQYAVANGPSKIRVYDSAGTLVHQQNVSASGTQTVYLPSRIIGSSMSVQFQNYGGGWVYNTRVWNCQVAGLEEIEVSKATFSPHSPEGYEIKRFIGNFRTNANSKIIYHSLSGYQPQYKVWQSDVYNYVRNANFNINHGLPLNLHDTRKAILQVFLQCKVANLGYDVGDTLLCKSTHPDYVGTDKIAYYSTQTVAPQKLSGVPAGFTDANWYIFFRLLY